ADAEGAGAARPPRHAAPELLRAALPPRCYGDGRVRPHQLEITVHELDRDRRRAGAFVPVHGRGDVEARALEGRPLRRPFRDDDPDVTDRAPRGTGGRRPKRDRESRRAREGENAEPPEPASDRAHSAAYDFPEPLRISMLPLLFVMVTSQRPSPIFPD